MAFLFPRVAFTTPARCGPSVRSELAPLFSLLDETFNEVQRASYPRHHRRSFAPRFDVQEVKDSYKVVGDVPGFSQESLDLAFEDEHTLVIKGHTAKTTESGAPAAAEATAQDAAATETSSEKSHQPTVEDEAEAPANASAVASAETATIPAPAAEQSKPVAEQPKSQYWVSERTTGEFQRSFSFPVRIDQEAVKASLKDGILSIVVPKATKRESRRIAVE